jgi:hypothetical protein
MERCLFPQAEIVSRDPDRRPDMARIKLANCYHKTDRCVVASLSRPLLKSAPRLSGTTPHASVSTPSLVYAGSLPPVFLLSITPIVVTPQHRPAAPKSESLPKNEPKNYAAGPYAGDMYHRRSSISDRHHCPRKRKRLPVWAYAAHHSVWVKMPYVDGRRIVTRSSRLIPPPSEVLTSARTWRTCLLFPRHRLYYPASRCAVVTDIHETICWASKGLWTVSWTE